MSLEWDLELVGHLAVQWQPRFGVRHLTTILRNRITEQPSVAEARGELKGVRTIRLLLLPGAPAARVFRPAPLSTVGSVTSSS
jgi:hypothetical protein